jgi:hypothetical protein
VNLDVAGKVSRVRFIFLPLGLCALVAIGAHAAADVVSDRTLWLVDRVDALFDALWSRWSFTAPLVDLVGLTQRTWFARAIALSWELAADALIAVPMLGYEERDAAREWSLAREMLRRLRSPLRAVRPLATLVVAVAGAASMSRMVMGSVLLLTHASWLAHLTRAATLAGLVVLIAPRAVFRSLEHASARRRIATGALALLVLVPLMLAAAVSLG